MAIKNLHGITVSPGNIRSPINCDFLDAAKGTFNVGPPDGYYFSRKMERLHYAGWPQRKEKGISEETGDE